MNGVQSQKTLPIYSKVEDQIHKFSLLPDTLKDIQADGYMSKITESLFSI